MRTHPIVCENLAAPGARETTSFPGPLFFPPKAFGEKKRDPRNEVGSENESIPCLNAPGGGKMRDPGNEVA